jgi:predicted alpha/beta-hydrolase family hydrolase
MIRYLDFNDAFVSLTHGAGHPSDTIAALLTAAELAERGGAEMEEKFRLMARKHLGASSLDNLLRLLLGIENEPQMSTLIAATRA